MRVRTAANPARGAGIAPAQPQALFFINGVGRGGLGAGAAKQGILGDVEPGQIVAAADQELDLRFGGGAVEAGPGRSGIGGESRCGKRNAEDGDGDTKHLISPPNSGRS